MDSLDVFQLDPAPQPVNSKKYDLEQDLVNTAWMVEKVKNSEEFAQALYAALCNNSFCRNLTWPILTEESWSCSWRYAGTVVATIIGKGDYLDWYCSGSISSTGSVHEGTVTDEVEDALYKLGWVVVEK